MNLRGWLPSNVDRCERSPWGWTVLSRAPTWPALQSRRTWLRVPEEDRDRPGDPFWKRKREARITWASSAPEQVMCIHDDLGAVFPKDLILFTYAR